MRMWYKNLWEKFGFDIQLMCSTAFRAADHHRAQIFLRSLYNQYACFKEWGRWFYDIQPGLMYLQLLELDTQVVDTFYQLKIPMSQYIQWTD